MQSGILVLHILVCIILIVLILLQSGREGMGVIFGGGGNSSVFGSQGAGGILVKLTTFLAVMFVVTSLGYNILTANKKDVKSILDVQFEESAPVAAPAPVQVPAQEGKAPAAEVVDQNAPKAEENAAPEAAPKAEENAAPQTAPAEEQKEENKTTGSITDKNANLVALNLKNTVTNTVKDSAKKKTKSQIKQTKQQIKESQKDKTQKTTPAPKQQNNEQPSRMNYNEG